MSMSFFPQLCWYALRTKPKQEDRAAANLTAWGVETLTPRIAGTSKQDRIRPLFPGYIFARFDIHARLRDISFTRGVLYVVSFGGMPTAVDEEVITAIRSRIGTDGIVKMSTNLNPGDCVMIHSGALKHLTGVFERETPDHERVQILLTAVAYSARVEVSRYEVIKLPANWHRVR